MSVSIGASAAGARAYTATASQGLLFMIEAVYNAAGLGLPIVMTLANRAIGAPINIWNDHSDAMAVRDSGWIQLFAETNQEAADLHVLAFRLAEELSVPVMVCMDGFILTHAVEGVDVPEQEHGRRVPAPVRAAPGPRSRRPGLDRRDGRPRGLRRGPLPRPSAPARRAGAHPGARRASSPRRSVARAAGCSTRTAPRTPTTIVVALGSVLGTIKDAVDELRDAGRARRRRRHHLLPAVPRRRGARRARAAPARSSSSRRPSASASAACSSTDVAHGDARDAAIALAHRGRGPRRTRRSRDARSRRCCAALRAIDLGAAHLPRPRPRQLVERERARMARRVAPVRRRRTSCATSAPSRPRSVRSR